jgi:hypothetical protein
MGKGLRARQALRDGTSGTLSSSATYDPLPPDAFRDFRRKASVFFCLPLTEGKKYSYTDFWEYSCTGRDTL